MHYFKTEDLRQPEHLFYPTYLNLSYYLLK